MTKHFIADIDYQSKTLVTKWARATFGQSKPAGVKMHEMRWYKRDMYATKPGAQQGSHWVTRFYFKNEADLLFFKLRWS